MSIMHKTTVYSLYTCGDNAYIQVHDGYLIEEDCAVYRAKPGLWYVIDINTGLAVCHCSTRAKVIDGFRAVYLSKLISYRANCANHYKFLVERMNTLYEDYVKGTC